MKPINIIVCILLLSIYLLSGCKDIFSDETQPISIIQPPPEASNITVTEPVFGTIRNPGDTLHINWIAPTINKIDIQLYRKSELKLSIVENLENNGHFEWKIPFEIPLSNHYLIKIVSHINYNIFAFSGQFGIQ